jgi:NTE family protein
MPTTTDVTPNSGAHLAEAAANFEWDGKNLEPGIALALSGGGFRAMLFHAGVLMRLNELGLLSRVKRISSVSGGSIAAGYLGAQWTNFGTPNQQGVYKNFQASFVDPILKFSRVKLDVLDALTGLLPWTSAAEEVAETYDRNLFEKRTLRDLPDEPRFVLCATNLQTGVLWRFSKPYAGDYVVGRLDKPKIPLAQAVAASSAFPPVLSPLLLRLPAGSFQDWTTGAGGATIDLTPFRKQVMLTDGGVYDNHGIEPIVKRYMTLFVSDGGAPFGRMGEVGTDWISQLRRVLDVTDNQVRALRRRDLIDRLRLGNKAFEAGTLGPDEIRPRERMGAYWGIDTDPDKVDPPDALPCNTALTDHLARQATRLSDLGDLVSRQLVNWGYAICDRSLRANYRGPVQPLASKPKWPYPEAALG